MEMKNQNAKDDEASATLGVDESLKRKKKGSSGGGFESMGLSEAVYQGVKKIGFRVPTPVQRQALPICLSGKDAVVMARTGSGKTAAFVLAILERMLAREQQYGDGASGSSVRALILSPTRELALQTLRVTQILASFTSFISVGIVGGDSIESQFSALSKRPHLLVATPGRLSHLLREIPDFTLENCYTLVLDEGDRLMEMGFLAQVREICAKMPSSESRQTMLFSATMPKSLVEFTRSGVVLGDDPAIVRLEKDVNVSEELRLGFITCRSDEKDAALLHLVRDVCSTLPKIQHMSSASGSTDDIEGDDVSEKKNKKSNSPKGLILIFAATRHHVEYLTTLLRLHSLRATQIYGAMDQEARQAALSSFRRGITPILVVTDVAARGIDVPLIDVVIHHSFPPSAKLFVHRSGRAARAGRLGWALSLVDPEEMPYMADLHVFLGRKLTSAVGVLPYSLTGMSTDMVHFGSVPEAILMEEMESLQRILSRQISGGHANDVETVQNLHKVCANAMKQFRKSRPNASREGVRRAKELSNNNGGFGNFPAHPLLAYWERQQHIIREKTVTGTANPTADNISSEDLEKYWEERKRRDEFLVAMANFRPKETIFESQASILRSSTSVKSSQVDKNKPDILSSKARFESGLLAMKNMRRQMRLIKSKCVVAGSATALARNGEADVSSTPALLEENVPVEESCPSIKSGVEFGGSAVRGESFSITNGPGTMCHSKKRISKAERKRLKAGQNSVSIVDYEEKGRAKNSKDFRDNDNFIDVETAFDERSRKIDASLQPSASEGNSLRSNAWRLEESMLNILGDESTDLVKHHRIMRWDKSKRKYVQTTLGAETSGDSKSKRLKLESGQLVKHDKAKLGKLYEKWQKKTHKSIGRVSVFDDVVDNDDAQADTGVGIRIQRSFGGEKGPSSLDQPKKKTAAQIKKEREDKSNRKLKNMKKADRKRFESKIRAKSTDARVNSKKKGSNNRRR